MQSKLIAAAIAAALLPMSQSFAADLPPAPAPPYRAPVVAPPPLAFSWTGFYLGGNVGYSSGSWTETATGGGLLAPLVVDQTNISGAIAGGQVGGNYQIGMFVIGIEADYQWSGEKSSSSFNVPDGFGGTLGSITVNDKIKSFGTVRGRAGVAFDRVFLYGTGGWAYATWGQDATGTVTLPVVGALATTASLSSSSGSGWTAGGGIEFAFLNNLTAKFEYLYIDMGNRTDTAAFTGVPGLTTVSVSDHIKDNVFRFGLNYLFNAGPVVARY